LANTGLGEAVFVMLRSALGCTGVVTLAVLLPELLSGVLLETLAVFVILEPVAVPELTFTTKLKVAVAPAARVALVQVTVPVPPAAGVVQVKVGPAVWVSDTKVVFVGMGSLSWTLCASDGPALLTVMV
jgi:hypothetical protein